MTLMETAQMLGNFGEFFGAIAVVTTLVFLVVQLRLNNVAIKAQTRSAVTDQVLAINHDQLSNPHLVAAQLKVISGSPLDDTEDRLMHVFVFHWFRQWENVFYQYRHGTFDEPEFAAQRTSWAHALQHPYWQETWQGIKVGFSPEFAREIDSILGPDAASAPPQHRPPTFGSRTPKT